MNSEKDKKEPSRLPECKEVNFFCDKAQYNEAELWEKAKVRVHLSECPLCREYSEKNRRLSKLIEKAALKTLTQQERDCLKQKLLEG